MSVCGLSLALRAHGRVSARATLQAGAIDRARRAEQIVHASTCVRANTFAGICGKCDPARMRAHEHAKVNVGKCTGPAQERAGATVRELWGSLAGSAAVSLEDNEPLARRPADLCAWVIGVRTIFSIFLER